MHPAECLLWVANTNLNTAIPGAAQIQRELSETACAHSVMCVVLACAKYWSQHHHIQKDTNTLQALWKLYRYICSVMCVVLMPKIGLSNTIPSATQIYTQQLETSLWFSWCVWCQCNRLVLTPPQPVLHKCCISETSTISQNIGNFMHAFGDVYGACAKYWSYKHCHTHST